MSDIPGSDTDGKMLADKKAGRKPSRKALLAFLGLAVILIICGIIFLLDGSQWYDFRFVPSTNVTIVISINSTGPQQVTILESGSDMVSISTHSIPGPSYYLHNEGNKTIVEYRLGNAYLHENANADIFVYLPRGNNYQIVLSGKDLYNDRSKIVDKYGTGNLTIRMSDPEHASK